MKNIIFVAAPAAGKGTQSDLLVKKYGYAHISTGDLLRNEVASGSEFGAELKKIMESGSLVSDEIVTELLKKRLECDDVNNGFILDGYPRNVSQAEALDNLLESLGKKIDVCISLDMDMETALKRALGRMSCPQCGTGYNKYFDAMKPKEEGICDNCGSTDLTEPRAYQLMMGLSIGATANGEINAYLRPETATTTYTNFKNVLDAKPHKLPFGIAQIGKAFRNEISPRGFVFRMREFEQAEMQYFVEPSTDEKYFEMWKNERMAWWINVLGIPANKLRFLPHEKLAHYAKAACDIEYEFPDGFDEVEGIHNRQDFDLGSHTKGQNEFELHANVLENHDSVTKLAYSDPQAGKTFIPYVIETAMGVNRAMFAVMLNAYTVEDLGDGKTRTVLKLKPWLSPVKAAVIPLARNVPELQDVANKIESDLRKLAIGRIEMENSGNIGKSYRRHDEIGTPVCITVDHQTLEDNTVTLRYRDTMEQIRIPVADVPDTVRKIVSGL